ncbi:hypothetical protein MO973_35025 [Paenibacillus sp. TRM 82003]|uniref:hypothetical protein n=1 Tax=Kineococcus sp. TRM81007 TaxID=2925831 RepID=UPI001F581331|nr:hypothetical protein [Kineococcus sp. TRM81007]MCI2240643.1 hypothetical protein [Kineococcus sp. TRM81007]MCI3925434.1 hypothetical protein [Paenibacillus sp. TRM 82003]
MSAAHFDPRPVPAAAAAPGPQEFPAGPAAPRVLHLQPVLATAVPAGGLIASLAVFAHAGPGAGALVAGGALLTGAALRAAHRAAALARSLREAAAAPTRHAVEGAAAETGTGPVVPGHLRRGAA